MSMVKGIDLIYVKNCTSPANVYIIFHGIPATRTRGQKIGKARANRRK